MVLQSPQWLLSVFGSTHAPPHMVVPLLQVKPQLVPLHVAVALAGGEQAVQAVVPQLLVEVFETQPLVH